MRLITIFTLFLVANSFAKSPTELLESIKGIKAPAMFEKKQGFHIQALDPDIEDNGLIPNAQFHSYTPSTQMISRQQRDDLLYEYGLLQITPSDFRELDYDIYFRRLKKYSFKELVKKYPFLKDHKSDVANFKNGVRN